jgi:hypothetical protein
VSGTLEGTILEVRLCFLVDWVKVRAFDPQGTHLLNRHFEQVLLDLERV